MGDGTARGGLGFWSGALFGLLFSAVVLVGLMLSAPMDPPATDPPAMDRGDSDPADAVAPAGESPDGAPEVALDMPPLPAPTAEIEAVPPEPRAEPQPEAPATPELEESVIVPQVASGPLWRSHAASWPLPDQGPLVAVVLEGVTVSDLPAIEALAALGPLTLLLDPASPDAAALQRRAATLNLETLALADDGDGPSLSGAAMAADMVRAISALPGVIGFALGGGGPRLRQPDDAAIALAEAARERALIFDVDPADGSLILDLGRSGDLPVAAPHRRLAGDTPAGAAFQTLRAVSDEAVREGHRVVLVEVSPATLTAVGRWLALSDLAVAAPLTALVERAGPTRY